MVAASRRLFASISREIALRGDQIRRQLHKACGSPPPTTAIPRRCADSLLFFIPRSLPGGLSNYLHVTVFRSSSFLQEDARAQSRSHSCQQRHRDSVYQGCPAALRTQIHRRIIEPDIRSDRLNEFLSRRLPRSARFSSALPPCRQSPQNDIGDLSVAIVTRSPMESSLRILMNDLALHDRHPDRTSRAS